MSKDFISFLKEDAVDGSVSSGSVANSRGSLFGGIISRNGTVGNSGKVVKVKKNKKALRESEHGNNFSADDVNSKIDLASRKSENRKDVAVFGLENSDGKIVKVYVPREESEKFHETLSKLVADETDIDVEEILFKLHREFNIVEVEFPNDFEENEEEVDNKLEGEKPEDNIPEEIPDDMNAQQPMDQGLGASGEDQTMGEPTPSNQDILMKVLDMLKAQSDAEASKAAAQKAEAEMKKQKLSVELTNQKIKTEEDMLAAENYYKQQQEERKNNDRLAKLAKYRSEIINSQQYEAVEEPSNFMNILEIFDLNEDLNDDINRLRLQINDLNLRKARAMKTFDDQINNLNKQLTNKQNLVSKQTPNVQTVQPNMQQPMGTV